MPFLKVQEHPAHYASRRTGEEHAPPALLVHGAGGSHQHWLYQVRDLPRTVLAVDLPGHGRSQGGGCDTISAYGDWLVRFLDAAHVDRAILVGHSMGGGIALDVALRYPERVAGLGLVATGARLRVAPLIFDSLRDDPERTISLIAEWSFSSQASPELVGMGRQQMARVPPTILHGDFGACDTFDVRERLAAITARALVICGTADRMTPMYLSMALRDRMPHARLNVIHGAGHMIMLERPAVVTRALGRFLVG